MVPLIMVPFILPLILYIIIVFVTWSRYIVPHIVFTSHYYTCMRGVTHIICMYVSYINVCVWLHVTASLARSGLDPGSCSPWTWCTGDSRTDPWNDPEIRTGSCSEDQTTIWTRNRVISCKYTWSLFLDFLVEFNIVRYLLISLCHRVSDYR